MALGNRELRRQGKEAGVTQDSIDAFEDGVLSKVAFVAMVRELQPKSPSQQHRDDGTKQELLALGNRALRARAQEAGVAQIMIDAFEDGDLAKEDFVDMVLVGGL